MIVPANIPFGEYKLIIVADESNSIEEISEENNYLFISTTPFIKVAGAHPDLIISDLNNLEYNANQGDVLFFDFDLNNIGTSPVSGDYDIDFYLSDIRFQHDITTSDELEGGVWVGSVSYTHLTLPTTPYV